MGSIIKNFFIMFLLSLIALTSNSNSEEVNSYDQVYDQVAEEQDYLSSADYDYQDNFNNRSPAVVSPDQIESSWDSVEGPLSQEQYSHNTNEYHQEISETENSDESLAEEAEENISY